MGHSRGEGRNPAGASVKHYLAVLERYLNGEYGVCKDMPGSWGETPADEELERAFEEATLYIGGIGNFDVSDRYLTHGCQWYVDPTHPENNRYLYNSEDADRPNFANERDTVNEECTSPDLWCYPTYSHRVCGGNGPPPPSFPMPLPNLGP